jgi:hypothetical protein
MVVPREAVTLSRIFFHSGIFTDFLCTCTVYHSRNGEAALGSKNTIIQENKNNKNTIWSVSKKVALEQYPKFTYLKSIDPSPAIIWCNLKESHRTKVHVSNFIQVKYV